MVTLLLTFSGFVMASTAMLRSGNTSERRLRSSRRRLPSMSRFCRSISRVTAVAGGVTFSQKLNIPSRQVKVSKMTSDTCTLRNDASSVSLTSFSASRALPTRQRPERGLLTARSRRSALTLCIRTSIAPRCRSSFVDEA